MPQKPDTARAICKDVGLSLSQWQKAKDSGIDVKDIEAMRAFRKTLNMRANGRKQPAGDTTESPGEGMTMEQMEMEIRRKDLDPNTARTLKLQIDSLRAMVNYKADMGKLVPRHEVEEHFVRAAMAMQSFLRRYEREIPALCLGLNLSKSTPLVKAKTREMQDQLASLESEFWKDHPENESI
jgi:hypothetical protein